MSSKSWALSGLVSLALVGVLAIGGCASSHALTQGEIGRAGSRSFSAPPPTVFYASVGALLASGYEIASEDLGQGVIVTKPMTVAGGGPVTARAYRLTISADEHGGSRVVAAPYLYAGARDVSGGDLWNLDGPRGEHALWTDLFSDIGGALVRPAPDASEREALAKMARPSIDSSAPVAEVPASGLQPAALGPAPRAPRESGK